MVTLLAERRISVGQLDPNISTTQGAESSGSCPNPCCASIWVNGRSGKTRIGRMVARVPLLMTTRLAVKKAYEAIGGVNLDGLWTTTASGPP